MVNDKEVDLLTLSEISVEDGTGQQTSSTGEKRPKKRYWPLFIIFLLGISAGWFFYEFIFETDLPGIRPKESIDTPKEGILLSQLESVVLEIQSSSSPGKNESKRTISLQNGENINLEYGKSTLRYRSISLKRGWLKSLFSKSPRIFLDGDGEILPDEDIVKRLEPEKSIKYLLTARFNRQSRPIGNITLKLKMSPEGWIYRISQLKDKREKQRLCYEKAERLGSINAELLIGYAELLKEMKQNKLAAQKYESVLKREPENLVALKNLSTLYFNMNPPEALNLFRKLIQLDPPNRISHYRSLADVQSRLGLDSALMTYRQILELSPGDKKAMKALDKLYIGLLQKAARFKQDGRLQEAIRTVEESRKIYLTKENSAYLAQLLHDLGSKMVENRRYDSAILQYKSSLKAQPYFKTYLSLAKTYSRLGKIEEAMQAIELAKMINPKDEKLTQELLNLEDKLLYPIN